MTRVRQRKLFSFLPLMILGVSLASLIGGILCLMLLWGPSAQTASFVVRSSGSVITVPRYDADGFPATSETVALTVGEDLYELDYQALILVAHNLLLLYGCVMVVCLAAVCCKRNKEGYATDVVQVARHIFPAFVSILISAYFAFSLSFFGEYYPTRWSDLPTWRTAIHTIAENLTVVLSADRTQVDLQFVSLWFAALVLGVVAITLLIMATTLFLLRKTQKRPLHALR